MNPIAKINLNSLRENIIYLKSLINSADLIPIIKANAYGHGYVEVLKILKNQNVKCVGIATVSELKEIINENLNIDILHLGKIDFNYLDYYLDKHVIATINTYKDVVFLKNSLKKHKKVRVHVKVDSGMHRMGCSLNDLDKIIKEIKNTSNIILEGIYSHLACSEDPLAKHNKVQISIFNDIIRKYKLDSVRFHLINSGGVFNYKECCFDFVRSGLSIFGVSSNQIINNKLSSVMELIAPVVLIKEVFKGDKIGYGCTYTVDKKMRIAILQCGYADGIPYKFGNRGFVFFKNKKLPILGKISMDLICIDCSEAINLSEKDYVTIWGGDMQESKLENISKRFGDIPYIYLTRLSSRVERVYIDE